VSAALYLRVLLALALAGTTLLVLNLLEAFVPGAVRTTASRSVSLGVPAAVAVLPLASALVSDPRPNVAVVLSVTAVAIVVVAMLVAVSPARRAAQTPVADALRAE
jgi:ABC-type lipoprotein release transport system permease subunit